MSYILRHTFQALKDLKKYDEEVRDPRVQPLLFCGNPMKLLTLISIYYVFVKHLGPKLMENRKPFKLKYIILGYNAIQVLANSWFLYEIINCLIVLKPFDDFSCIETFFDNSYKGIMEVRLSHFYATLKLLDYLDTIFFVLRKRFKQISFLHFYHHIVMSIGSFAILRYQPGGHMIGLGLLNGFVHVVMYSYYFISALKTELNNSLWWKKYITQLQIAQFLLLTLHFFRPLLHENCSYPRKICVFALSQNAIMLILFTNFYLRTYIRKPQGSIIKKPLYANGEKS